MANATEAQPSAMDTSGTNKSNKLFGQISRFAVVGVLNTAIDIVIYNICLKLGMIPELANMAGVSVAIINSYLLNKYWTFKDTEKEHVTTQFGLFVVLSLVGMAINTAGLSFLTRLWLWPGNLAFTIVDLIGLGSVFGKQFVVLNFAKLAAIGISMVWNFVSYKKWAFKG